MSNTLTVRLQLQRRRKWVNTLALALSLLAMIFGLIWLGWILETILVKGLSALSFSLFTESTPAAGTDGGGFANALVGSLIMVVLATVLGTPLGLLAGIYLVEYGQKSHLAQTVTFVNDILLAGPSIIIGLFVYSLYVVPMGGYSGWAGVFALALVQLPIVIRTTENMLKLVPHTLREAAMALGAPKWKMILFITLKAARAGILTGVLLGIARIAGETAPLLFTALNSMFFSLNMNAPLANLPKMIYDFAMSPYARWQEIAWAGVLVITVGVLFLNILARILN
ncbi:MAG: phosphate ABC transporter permease PstA, partial [Gammaproteobacteria bacterium]